MSEPNVPIEIVVRVNLGDDRAAIGSALRHLDSLHGFPNGFDLDLEGDGSPALVAATCALMCVHEVRLRIVDIGADGRARFEVAT